MAKGGRSGSWKQKGRAGRVGGKWSGAKRRSSRRTAEDGVSLLTSGGRRSRTSVYTCDLSFGQFVRKMHQMDKRKQAGYADLTDNVILAHAHFERIDKTRDAVFQETVTAVRSLMRDQRPGWRKACLRVIAAVVCTGGPRGGAQTYAAIAHSLPEMARYLPTAACANKTFRCILSRQTLAHGALESMVVSALGKHHYADVVELAERMAESAYAIEPRRPHFHTVEIVWWLSLMPFLGFTFSSHAVPRRLGMQRGLSIVRRQRNEQSVDEASLAAETHLSLKEVHTGLCAYHKYVRYYHRGIGRWYLEPPRCCRI